MQLFKFLIFTNCSWQPKILIKFLKSNFCQCCAHNLEERMESHPRREQKHSASSSNLKTRCIFAFFPIASMCVYEFATSSAGWATSPISLFAFFLLLAVTAWQLLSLRVSKFFSAVGSLPVWLIVCGCMFVCACVHLTSLGSFPSVCVCVCCDNVCSRYGRLCMVLCPKSCILTASISQACGLLSVRLYLSLPLLLVSREGTSLLLRVCLFLATCTLQAG